MYHSFNVKYSILLSTFCVQHIFSFHLFTVNSAYYCNCVEIPPNSPKSDAMTVPEVCVCGGGGVGSMNNLLCGPKNSVFHNF